MITENGELICDECGRKVDFIRSYAHDADHWCNECVREIGLYFNLEKVGRYCLYPDGQARVWVFNRYGMRGWAVMIWEAQARAGEEPLRVLSRLADRDEFMAREFLCQIAESDNRR